MRKKEKNKAKEKVIARDRGKITEEGFLGILNERQNGQTEIRDFGKSAEIVKQKEGKKINLELVFSTFLLFTFYLGVCLVLINYPLEFSKFVLPTIYVSTTFWLILFGVVFSLAFVSFSIISKQGANKKVFGFYLLFGIFLVFEVIFSYIFELMWVSLFLSAITLFFCFVILHELKKTNKKAYAFFLPCLVICGFVTLNYYVISMIN